jgi:hypothetical protein
MEPMAQPSVHISVGDVFSIPLDGTQLGHGQVVDTYGSSGGHFFFVAFRRAYSGDDQPTIAAITADRLALLALSLDSLLQVGHWQIVGHDDVATERVPWPTYKLATAPDTFIVEDHTGSHHRPAAAEEVAALRFRAVVAPIRVENALKALHGLGDWLPEYTDLLVR